MTKKEKNKEEIKITRKMLKPAYRGLSARELITKMRKESSTSSVRIHRKNN